MGQYHMGHLFHAMVQHLLGEDNGLDHCIKLVPVINNYESQYIEKLNLWLIYNFTNNCICLSRHTYIIDRDINMNMTVITMISVVSQW